MATKEKSSDAWEVAARAIAVPQKYGFEYEYAYDKSSDASCVYIHRFKKGRDRFEMRVLAGAETLSIVSFVGGEYRFPDVRKKYKKRFRSFRFSHLFKKPTEKETWDLYAELLEEEAKGGSIFYVPVD